MTRYTYEGLGILMWGGWGDRLRFLLDILVFDIPWPPISHIILWVIVWTRLVCSWCEGMPPWVVVRELKGTYLIYSGRLLRGITRIRVVQTNHMVSALAERVPIKLLSYSPSGEDSSHVEACAFNEAQASTSALNQLSQVPSQRTLFTSIFQNFSGCNY
jgi:hypothetical protein